MVIDAEVVPLLRLTPVGLDSRVKVPEGLLAFHTHAESS
jgi:hypothetical protein